MEQNSRPSLFLQVFREAAELNVNKLEDDLILNILGSYQNEKFDEVVEWINEASKILPELTQKQPYHQSTDSFWCNNMILKIRKLRAKRGLNFTFQRVNNVGSSSNMLTMAPPSLSEEFYCEMASLVSIYQAESLKLFSTSEGHQEWVDEVTEFLGGIKAQLERNFPELISDWYGNKIAETRTLIAKCEPAFSLQPQDARSSSMNMHTMALHSFQEELDCEIRSLNSLKCADLIFVHSMVNVPGGDILKKQFQEWINEVNKLLAEINLQLEVKFIEKDLDWYRYKIAEGRTLIAKRYLACPLRPEDVGYKEYYQIFLSFRGEDTRDNITLNLYNALHQEGFNVFKDDRGLQRGDPIAQVLMRAIENSKLSIIIFSTNFADSTWCLDEVVKILDCMKKKNQLVWPIFYKVEPSYVDKAMVKQEIRFGKDSEKVNKWRIALNQVCGLDAFHYRENNGCEESDFIQSILEAATKIRYYL